MMTIQTKKVLFFISVALVFAAGLYVALTNNTDKHRLDEDFHREYIGREGQPKSEYHKNP